MCVEGGGVLDELVDSLCFGFRLILLEQRSRGWVQQIGESEYGVSSRNKDRLEEINRQNVLKCVRAQRCFICPHMLEIQSQSVMPG